MNSDWKRLINVLLLEHACKYNMIKTFRYIVKDEELVIRMCFENTEIEGTSLTATKIQPLFFLIMLMKELLHSLEKSLAGNISMPFNTKILSLIIELLSAYQRFSFIPSTKHIKLLTRLKLLASVRLLMDGAPSNYIIQKLNSQYFPRWDANYDSKFQSIYNIKNEEQLAAIKHSNHKCRMLILSLAASDAKLKNLISNKGDVIKMTREVILGLKQLIELLEKSSGPSVIEKIIDGIDDEIRNCNDPSVQLFLEYLQPNMTEDEIIKLLHSLESTSESQMEYGFSACLDILSDVCSETMSEIGCSQDLDSDRETFSQRSAPHVNDALYNAVNPIFGTPERRG